MTSVRLPAASFTVILVLLPHVGQSAEPAAATVMATGTASLERSCQIMRLQLDLLARADDISAAASQLEARAKAAVDGLAGLGADRATIRLDSPRLSDPGSDRQSQLEMMVRQQVRARTRPNAKKKEFLSVVQSLTADFALPEADGTELLIKVHELQSKIREADFAGLKAIDEAMKEDEDLAEAMEEMQSQISFGGMEEQRPGEPVFLFLARWTDDQHAPAMVQAFADARKQAKALALAAGRELGELTQLTGHEAGEPISYGGLQGFSAAYYQMMGQDGDANPRHESTSTTPGLVRKTLTINATFTLK